MDRLCNCGQWMRLELRTILAGKIQILHVPMRACEGCSVYHLFPPVKSVLADYVKNLGNDSRKRKRSFTDVNEISQIIYEVFSQETCDSSASDMENAIKAAINDRVNLLLDLFQHAKSIDDHIWIEDLRQRLSQLSSLLVELDRDKVYSYE
ncbi:hypothetical protein [Paenibacillus glacialis]|uniref:Uncharacterized protein n=1 Tax=Paenibacillus glacialis TaxID=494026 RepID=A0A168D3D2_9BACL|nr:hypothetical protein [Paenibacillus glacialis]OAB33836.1 hypothetical protein PGLA_23205 [Paenibacillus glacialis]